ncbi:copper homeostasis membrane protein CopD [Sphingopyxis sp. GW247-27LB]|uniref:copper homeostasis membrane protein CopD n=1 Tax=Sphingopyxis sp. GW247-27LB TaxID=2012632 RepID=UPI000BA5C3C5|nr:copper homeostasis membrane protein CopD [Sphingopyxis sp. GW247-27LB]PAL19775.1 copper resistance protein CopD [Sphingopyxis sp. GW247-27LB]
MEPGAIHLLRWALYTDLGLLFGMPLFALYNPGAEHVPRKLLLVLAIAGIVLTLASLQLTSAAMAGASAAQIDPQLLGMVVGQTGFGRAALVRLILLSALAAIASITAKNGWLATMLGGGALLTLAWAGHGNSTPRPGGSIHLAAGLIHLLAAGTWLGALAMFLRLIPRDVEVCYAALRRFSTVGTIAVIALAASGLINVVYQIDLDQRGWGPPNVYERLLLLKLVLFGGMLVMASINRFKLTPRLAARSAATGIAESGRALRTSISVEFTLALAVLALVGWLGTLDPAS